MAKCEENVISRRPPLIVGNSLAVLVGVHELIRRGQPVIWLTDGRRVGGHFAGLLIGDYRFDIGMVFLEKSESFSEGSLGSYNPSVRNDWVRFGMEVTRWIEAHFDTVKCQTPNCLVEGGVVPDYLLANRLDVLGSPAASALVSGLAHLSRQDPRHPIHKHELGVYDDLSYQDAALLSHGQQFHKRFIDPFVRKVLGVSSSDFLARFHRLAWAPLYYPETLASASLCGPPALKEYEFWTTSNGSIGETVQRLTQELSHSPLVTVIETPIEAMEAAESRAWRLVVNGAIFEGPLAAFGLPSDRACSLLGVRPPSSGTSPVAMGFFLVKENSLKNPQSCLTVVEEGLAAYRLTDQDAAAARQVAWHRLALEASPDRLRALHPGLSLAEAMTRELCYLLGMEEPVGYHAIEGIQTLKCLIVENALPIPTKFAKLEAERVFNELQEMMPGTALTATLLALGAGSMNDQIVQGLRIVEEWN